MVVREKDKLVLRSASKVSFGSVTEKMKRGGDEL